MLIGQGIYLVQLSSHSLILLLLCSIHILIHIPGDNLVGEVSRLVVAEACIQALDIDFTEGQIYEINSVKVIFLRS